MKILKFLKRINNELSIDNYKKEFIQSKKDRLKFEKILHKTTSMGLIIRKKNILKLTPEGRKFLKSELHKDSKLKKNEKESNKKQDIKIDINNAKKDAQLVAKSYNIPIDFPKKCLQEAKLLPDSMENVSLEYDRIDLRNIKTVTIDGVDSKDFDDAISVEKLDNGYKIGVHIADVSYFVPIGSALDREARKRGNSVYLIDTVYPMFPHELSNGICSLNEGVSRFTMTVFTTIDNDGNILDSSFHKSVIKSNRRLTYDYAQDLLDGIDYDDDWLLELLNNANDVKNILLKKRIENGSIEFDLNENKIILDRSGNPKDFFVDIRKESHKLIEEFMLLANCEVAKKLSHINGAIYRVHDAPDSDKLDSFMRIAFNRGYRVIKDSNGNIDFISFIESIHGKPDEKLLLTLLLRSMKQAIYDVKNIGHFGLGFEYYTHFTSPIRRYTDLLTHRLLKLVLDGENKLKPSMEKMFVNCADWCSKTERVAVDCERSLEKIKATRFMRDKIGNEYDGIISGVTNFGIFVEIEDRGIEGLIRYSTLKNRYTFYEDELSACSDIDEICYTLGDRIRVVVSNVSVENMFIDFLPVGEVENIKINKKSNKNKKVKKTKSRKKYSKDKKFRQEVKYKRNKK